VPQKKTSVLKKNWQDNGEYRKNDEAILKQLDNYALVLKPADAQPILRISGATFFSWIDSGKVPRTVMVGGNWKVQRDTGTE